MKVPFKKVPLSLETLCRYGDIGENWIIRGPYEYANDLAEYGIGFYHWIDENRDEVYNLVEEVWDSLTEDRQREILKEQEGILESKLSRMKQL